MVWLAVFLSPTVCCLLLLVWSRSELPAPPPGVVVSLFCLVPVVALLACGTAVWRTELRAGWKVGWLVAAVLAMALQVGVLLVLIVRAINAAISLPQ